MILVQPPHLLQRLRLSLPSISWLRRAAPRSKGQCLRVAMSLPAGAFEVIEQLDRQLEVRCVQGELWVTRDGDPKDMVLREQESCTVRPPGRLLFHAVTPIGFELRFAVEPG